MSSFQERLRELLRLRYELKWIASIPFVMDLGRETDRNGVFPEVILPPSREEPLSQLKVFGDEIGTRESDDYRFIPPVERKILSIRDAHLAGMYLLPLSNKRKLLVHHVGGHRSLVLANFNLLRDAVGSSLRKVSKHYDSVFVSPCIHASNYFCWVMEFLSGLEGHSILCKKLNEDIPLLIPETYKAWQKELIELMGYPPAHYIETSSRHITANKAYFFTKQCNRRANLNKESFNWISNRAIAHARFTDSRVVEKVYINRRDSSKTRGITNLDEIERYLGVQGFVSTTLSKLKVSEQIDLFRHAKVIVAEHGAGLTNLLFSRQAIVVEILPPNFDNNNMRILAHHAGADYRALVAEKKNNGRSVVNMDHLQDALYGVI